MSIIKGEIFEISIHALCEEGDPPHRHRLAAPRDFYPRPLRGGRRFGGDFEPRAGRFLSTPSARRATLAAALSAMPTIFLSTPSARRATSGVCAVPVNLLFLSTPSARRATAEGSDHQPRAGISIHALCEEGDGSPLAGCSPLRYFYPRPLRGGRHPVVAAG